VSVCRIKKNDVVIVISGSSAGKTGKVLQVLPAKGRAVVEGVNLRKKATRKSQDNPKGGIVDREAPLALSKLMLFDPDAKKGVRIKRVKEGGKSVRKSKASSHMFDR
jgi:large subunit ribosomal protein L24